MKKMKVLLGVVALAVFCGSQALVFAQQVSKTPFDKDTSYDVYYEVAQEKVTVVRNVKIDGLVDIEGKEFLKIAGVNFGGKEKYGYILFDIIKAILPNGQITSEERFVLKTED